MVRVITVAALVTVITVVAVIPVTAITAVAADIIPALSRHLLLEGAVMAAADGPVAVTATVTAMAMAMAMAAAVDKRKLYGALLSAVFTGSKVPRIGC
ncbi:MAG: hypothetical protein JWQ69_5648 [Pseudomonas sp.]|nr:hypothetical protein [Pseudomonas sp.]